MALSREERLRFLKALEEDEEFRLAVAGLLGLREVLDELRRLREDFHKFVQMEEERWRENEKRWEENWKRWEENARQWQENWRRWEENEKRWQENWRRWEENAKRWEENQRRWEENWKRWEENTRRWEENERRWQENDKRWERAFEEFRWIRSALTQIQEALGVSLEFYTAQWIREWLAAKGFTCNPIVHAALLIDGIKEVDVFCPDPLVVAEVKSAVPTVDEADRALEQLRRAVEAAEKFARTRIYAAVLAVETAPEEVARYLQAKAGEAGYLLVLGRKAK
ncbi:MAG: hypothetical protein RXO30_02335 [Thermoproteus sp.]